MAHWFLDKVYDSTEDFGRDLDQYETETHFHLKISQSRSIETFRQRRKIADTFPGIKYYECYLSCATVTGRNTDRAETSCPVTLVGRLDLTNSKFCIKKWSHTHNHIPYGIESNNEITWVERMSGENKRKRKKDETLEAEVTNDLFKKIKIEILKDPRNQKKKIDLLTKYLGKMKEMNNSESESESSTEDENSDATSED